MTTIPTAQALEYLKSKGLDTEDATPAQMSDANSYSTCYDWYTSVLGVTAENAAIASKVWVQKYALHNRDGICLEATPEDMWGRIANELAKEEVLTNKIDKRSTEEWSKYFYAALEGFKYTPQGSGLYALGNPFVKSSASNCFVVDPPQDSLESIFNTAKSMARIYSFRGGVGTDLSDLRPYGARTNNAAKTSTGASSFMDFYSYVTGTIGQAGRRGALMLSMRVDHPDVLRFIRMKRDIDKQPFFDTLTEAGIDLNDWKWSSIADRLKSTSFANVSVKLTRKFIKAVKEDADFELFYDFKDELYPRISETIKAREIWNELMEGAWQSAEPGIFNWDLILEESPADCYLNLTDISLVDPQDGQEIVRNYSFRTVSTNPCGEVPLSGGDSCCLGTFYLYQFVKNPWTPEAYFDFEAYKEAIRIGTRAQDNIKNWDSRILPLEQNRVAAILGRRISVGNHGLADAMAACGIRYDLEDAIAMADKIYGTLKNTVYATSVQLAQEKGAFQVWDWEKEKDNPFLNRLDPEVLAQMKIHGRRNIACLTNAPTGSMSILSRNSSSGIEPVFMISYTRNVKKPGTNDNEQFPVYHQAVQDCITAGGDISVFIEAGAIDPEHRIRMQAAIQKHIDHAISVTTNLKADVTKEQVGELYMMAFDLGCKGMTVYREGSRTGVLVSNAKKKPEIKKILERPKTTEVDIHKVVYKKLPYMVLVGNIEGKPIEVFAGLESDLSLPSKYVKAELTKKARGHYTLIVQLSEDEEDVLKVNNIGARFPAQDVITITRMISLLLKNGVSISEICDQLSKSASSLYDSPAVLARVLKTYISEDEYAELHKGKPCPDCGSELQFRKESGCMTEYCTNCNHSNSKCG